MTYSEICDSVSHLKRKYEETDPERLCKLLGIIVERRSLGVSDKAIKGFFVRIKRISLITVNGDLPKAVQRIIIAHELCHALHHKTAGASAYHDFSLFDETNEFEKEANLFAAELLMDDDEVLENLNGDYTFYDAAKIMRVSPELLDFKFRIMKWKGYRLAEAPVSARNDFLKKI